MANAEHLERLKQGVEVWNQWRFQRRLQESKGKPDLSGADLHMLELREVDLREANLSGANLHGADLDEADLSHASLDGADLTGAFLSRATLRFADLSGAILMAADLAEADLSGANFRYTDLSHAFLGGANLSVVDLRTASLGDRGLPDVNLSRSDLRGCNLSSLELICSNLSEANLRGANLNEANLSEANLSGANLSRIRALGTTFQQSILTGACLEDWHVNSATNFDNVVCEYFYFRSKKRERRPRSGSFQPGDFIALFQQVIDTVDLIFKDGIDWQSFFASLQEIRQQYDESEINIQAIEKKSGGAFVVRLEVSDSLDKALLQKRLNTVYEENQQLRSQLLKTAGKLEGYKEQLDDFQQKVLQGMNSPKYDLRGAEFGGGFIETNYGTQHSGTINNSITEPPSLTEATTEIQNLLIPLKASNPTATQSDQIAFLNLMIPPTRRERFISALQSAGNDDSHGSADTTNTALEDIPHGPLLKALVKSWQSPGSEE